MPEISAVFKISQVIFILIFVSLGTLATDQAAVPQRRQDHIRTCLNYGHACWGAHGKRSGDKNLLFDTLMSKLRESREPTLLDYSNAKRSLNSDQWIPMNWFDIYNKGSRTSRANNEDDDNYVPIFKEPSYFSKSAVPRLSSSRKSDAQNEVEDKVPYYSNEYPVHVL